MCEGSRWTDFHIFKGVEHGSNSLRRYAPTQLEDSLEDAGRDEEQGKDNSQYLRIEGSVEHIRQSLSIEPLPPTELMTVALATLRRKMRP